MKRGIILIGAGNWGQSWLKFIHESNDWELAALVSRGGENLAKARQAWSIPEERVFSSLADALKGPGEVVLTTAPHHLHVPHALEAMAAGRTALIEKPLSDDFAQARQLADAKTGPGAYVVQNFRFRPGFWRIRRSIAAGELGDPLAVRLNFRIAGPRKAGAPPQAWRQAQWSFLLNEIIIHHFDMCRFLTGQDAEWISCHGWRLPWLHSDGPESATATVGLSGGAIFDYSGRVKALCGPATKFDGHWLIETDRGCAWWDGEEAQWQAGQGESGELLDESGFPGFDRAGVLNDLRDALDGRRPAALPDAGDNLKSLAMVFAAIRSVQENGRRVELAEIME
ncbi:MAG: 4-carboxy-2-hydroxymuconate-6-semialdehyde dehydrogenase [candidate division BRC1 bacterium ADurb.BinA364]|nr:MAG: 4-carboxy-2-hydroxymuconate-6-semialdehyde dehydrogenase [candidate division BRC1 bacterium ADurb.BinA364]